MPRGTREPATDCLGVGPPTVHLLGGFALRSGSGPISLSESAKRLLAVVALRGSMSRSELVGCLWPDTSEKHALGRLRTQLWRVNLPAPHVLECGPGFVTLAPDVSVDVRDFVRRARQILDGTAASSADLRQLCSAGELLPGWHDHWLIAERERLRQLWLHVCEIAAVRLSHEGHHGLALETALVALGADEMRESAHRTVIRVHLEEGNRGEAVRMYARCEALMLGELGVAPTFTVDSLVDPPETPSAPPAGGSAQ